MTSKLEEIQSECPNIQTMSIVADFGVLCKIEEYKTTIADMLTGLDVSVVVVNAGFNKNKAWLELEDKDIQNTVMLNSVHPAYFSKVMSA